MIKFHGKQVISHSMTVTDAAGHFTDLVNRTYYRGESTVLLRSGESVAMVIPVGGSVVTGLAAKMALDVASCGGGCGSIRGYHRECPREFDPTRIFMGLIIDSSLLIAAICLRFSHKRATQNEGEFSRVEGLMLANARPCLCEKR